MTNSLFNQKRGLSMLTALILGIITVSIHAQNISNDKEHIEVDVHDSSGNTVMSGYGECWHTHLGQAKLGQCSSRPIANSVAPAPASKPARIVPPSQIEKPVVANGLTILPPKKITLDTSKFFDFGEPILRPSARAELDDFIEKLSGTNPQKITVIGHADRIGTANYNQILSEQRAATVKAYLVRKGVSPDIVLAEGRGDTQPITKKDQCPSEKTPQAIACLQPDRRVEVEVTGTKIEP